MTLHNEEEAIKQAVEAGYPTTRIFLAPLDGERWFRPLNDAAIFQDPAFWQALGKVRGWSDVSKFGDINFGRPGVHTGWLPVALRYFEVKLSGGDLSQFWTSLP